MSYSILRRKSYARGFVLHHLLDPSTNVTRVVVTRSGTVVEQSSPMTREEGEDVFDAWDFGLEIRFGLKTVLNYCMSGPREQAPPWNGSQLEAITKVFGIGTWEWVQALGLIRRQELA